MQVYKDKQGLLESAVQGGLTMDDEKTCSTCKWYKYDTEFEVYFCLCIDSPISAEEVKPDETCRAWEGRK